MNIGPFPTQVFLFKLTDYSVFSEIKFDGLPVSGYKKADHLQTGLPLGYQFLFCEDLFQLGNDIAVS